MNSNFPRLFRTRDLTYNFIKDRTYKGTTIKICIKKLLYTTLFSLKTSITISNPAKVRQTTTENSLLYPKLFTNENNTNCKIKTCK